MQRVARLAWDELSWTAFVAGLKGYRDHFSGKDREDRAYFRSLAVMQARPLAARPALATDLVRLLNTWACRLSSARAPGALEAWLQGHVPELERLEPLTILDPRARERGPQIGALHDDLIAHMRASGVLNMSDAAASKALHMVIPALFVMWDKEIRRSAPEGYGEYLLQMHGLAHRLVEQAPVRAEALEAHLQELLGYDTRKPLAKYLDEYSWFEAVGRGQLAVKDGRRGRSRAAPG
jgi:hypothetical protein